MLLFKLNHEDKELYLVMEHLLALSTLDWLVVGIYFFGIFVLVFKLNKSTALEKSQDYFLAGRNLGWFLVGASLFASNIGSEHLIGLASAGASSGVAVGQFEVLASFMLLILGWVFVPFYIKTGVTTMPEFLQTRFSRQARNYLTVVSIIAYILTKISVTIYAGGIVFSAVGVPFWIGALIVVGITGIYTVTGGLKAVIYTDAFQMVIMLIGSILLTVLGLVKLGGIDVLTTTLEPGFFNMWLPMHHPDFPWTGILFGAPILGVWYWCTDQYVVQRTLSAANLTQARRGSIFAGFLKLLPVFIFVLPGLVCAALASKGMVTIPKNDYDQTLPILASFVLPVGLKGLFIAGLLAALMSSLSSVFNSCSTLITYDLVKLKYPKMSEANLIKIGKLSTLFLVFVGILWIPFMSLISNQMYLYIQSVQAYISPPIAAVFLLGVLWRRLNARGAIAALYTGLVVGTARFIGELFKSRFADKESIVYHFTHMNFLHFAAFLFVLSAVIMVVVSYCSKPQATDSRLAVSLYDSENQPAQIFDLFLSGSLVLSVFGIWWLFS